MAHTLISDVIVPQIFSPYVQQITEEKTRLIQSGVLVRDPMMDNLLNGGGLTFNVPSWKDLANVAENISTDAQFDFTAGFGAPNAIPQKTSTSLEIAVRLSRNQHWSTSDLAGDLAGSDPALSIANRVGNYWSRRLQAAFVATLTGIFADNAAAPSGSEHVLNDMTVDISGGAFLDGVTNFSAEAFIDATLTMGDSMENLAAVLVHSTVYARMQKNNLIDFIPDSRSETNIATFLGREVVVDDTMPFTGGVFQTWLLGRGALRLGMGNPKVPTEITRFALAGLGGGQEVLSNRAEWSIHPVGNKFAVGSPAAGGPSNANTAGNLAHVDSWQRVYPERKQIAIARLITREF